MRVCLTVCLFPCLCLLTSVCFIFISRCICLCLFLRYKRLNHLACRLSVNLSLSLSSTPASLYPHNHAINTTWSARQVCLWGRDQALEDKGFVLFALLNVVWASMWLEGWKRHSAELAYNWGTLDTSQFELLAEARPHFTVS